MDDSDNLLDHYLAQRALIDTASDPDALFVLDYVSTFGPISIETLAMDMGLELEVLVALCSKLENDGLLSRVEASPGQITTSQIGRNLIREILSIPAQKAANTVIRDSAEHAARSFALLKEITSALTTQFSLPSTAGESIIGVIVSDARRLVQADVAQLVAYQGGALKPIAHNGSWRAPGMLLLPDSELARLLSRRTPWITSDLRNDLRTYNDTEQLRSMLVMPLPDHGNVDGCLIPLPGHGKIDGCLVLGARVEGAFGQRELTLLDPVTDLLWVALKQIERNHSVEWFSNVLSNSGNPEEYIRALLLGLASPLGLSCKWAILLSKNNGSYAGQAGLLVTEDRAHAGGFSLPAYSPSSTQPAPPWARPKDISASVQTIIWPAQGALQRSVNTVTVTVIDEETPDSGDFILEHLGIRRGQVLFSPIQSLRAKDVVGVLVAGNGARGWPKNQLSLLGTFGRLLAPVLEMQRLQDAFKLERPNNSSQISLEEAVLARSAMPHGRVSLTFPDATREAANIFATSLSDQLKDVDRSIRVETMKDRSDTMDFGTTLVLVLGTAAVTEVAKGIAQWLARHKTKVQLTVGGDSLTISDSDPESVAKIFRALSSKA